PGSTPPATSTTSLPASPPTNSAYLWHSPHDRRHPPGRWGRGRWRRRGLGSRYAVCLGSVDRRVDDRGLPSVSTRGRHPRLQLVRVARRTAIRDLALTLRPPGYPGRDRDHRDRRHHALLRLPRRAARAADEYRRRRLAVLP